MNKPRGRRNAPGNGAAKLLAALKFVAQVAKSDSILESHCHIVNNTISATDGVISIGVPIEIGFTAIPHMKTLIVALEKCGEQISIVVENDALSIKSGKAKYKVQCAPVGSLPTVNPDYQIAPVNDSVRHALKVAGMFTKEGELHVAKAAVVLDAYLATGTNGFAIIQVRHECNLPPKLNLPKRFVDLAYKHNEQLIGFGYNEGNSATFWFADGSFIKCQMFTEQPPDFERVFNVASNPLVIPDEFFDAIRATVAFGNNNAVEFVEGGVRSYPDRASSAFYEVAPLPVGKVIDGQVLLQLEEVITSADFETSPDRVIMFGQDCRAIVMCKKV